MQVNNQNSKNYSEEELIAELRNKNEAALSYFYDRYSTAMLGIAFKITGSNEISEEILQDAFLKAWNSFETYDASKGRLFTWMLNITRNMSIDRLRSKDYKKNYKNPGDNIDVSIIKEQASENSQLEYIGVKDIMDKLNDEQKQLIDLAYFKGYKQTEIAEKLDMPLGTVKTKIRAALISLRKFMQIEKAKY